MLRIRKLTPKECMRLMGFADTDYQALRDIGMSDSAIFHMAGDSLVVPLMASMLYQFLPDSVEMGHIKIVDEYVKNNVRNQ